MFYAPAILAKKGDLSHVWIAAHWHNKLSKQQVQSLDIAQSVQQIKQPSVPLSLRLSGQLLHGVARIHQKKVAYLFTDCNEALVKIKMAFRPAGHQPVSTSDSAATGATTTSATPARINAPALDDDDRASLADSSSSSARGGASRRFRNVEIQVDEDDWTKMTPVHTRRSVLGGHRRTPSMDLDFAAAAAAANDDAAAAGARTPTASSASVGAAGGGEQWSEFPFMSDEPNSIEVVRRGHNDSNVRLSTLSVAADQQPHQQEDYVPPDEMMFGDDFHHQEQQQQQQQQPPKTPGTPSGLVDDLAGLLLLQSAGNSAGKLKSTWLQDVESRRNEEPQQQQQPSPAKKDSGTPKTATRTTTKRHAAGAGASAATIELSDDVIKNAMQDTSDIVLLSASSSSSVRARIQLQRQLQAGAFQFRPSRTPQLDQSSLPLHAALAARLASNCTKPVSYSKEQEEEEEEEELEVAREQQQQQPHDQSLMDVHQQPPAQEEMYVMEDAPVFGDEQQQQQEHDLNQAANHALEETFVDDSLNKRLRMSTEQPEGAAEGTEGEEEDERWNPQTIKMMRLLREKLTDAPVIAYQDLARGERKLVVAKAFFEVLQLTTRGMLAVSQQDPFGEILIVPGPKYDTLLPTEST